MAKQVINDGESGLVVRTKLNENTTELYDKDAAQDIVIAGKAETAHTHTGVYEPADATILKEADIGVTVEAKTANLVVDASYVHTDNNYTTVEKNKLSGVADNANNYVHPASHTLADISDSGTAASKDVGVLAGNVVELELGAKLPAVDGSQLTNLPEGNILTADQEAAIDGANLPSGSNVFATVSDIPSPSSADMEKSVYDPTLIGADVFSMDNMVEGLTKKILTDTERSNIATNTNKVGITAQQATDIDTNTAHRGLTNNPHSVDKADIGLSNVDNTSDLDKPISSATIGALNGKSDTTHTHTGIYEPADTAIQAHITDVHHALPDAQPNNLITKSEIEAKLTGTITTHLHTAPVDMVSTLDTDTSTFSFVLDEDSLSSDSATKLATQQSIKKYIDDGAIISAAGAPATNINPTRLYQPYLDSTKHEFYICTDITTDANVWVKTTETTDTLASNVLQKDNTNPFTPSLSYHPATKQYVDDTAGAPAGGGSGSPTLSNILALESISNADFKEIPNGIIESLENRVAIDEAGQQLETAPDGIKCPVNNFIGGVPGGILTAIDQYLFSDKITKSEPLYNSYINFLPGGMRLEVMDNFTSRIGLYNLDVPYDLESIEELPDITTNIFTAAYHRSYINYYHEDGSFIIMTTSSSTLARYDLLTPWDLTSAVFHSSISSYQGRSVYVLDEGHIIHVYYTYVMQSFYLTTAYDLSTATLYEQYSIDEISYLGINDIKFSEDGYTFVASGGNCTVIATVPKPFDAHNATYIDFFKPDSAIHFYNNGMEAFYGSQHYSLDKPYEFSSYNMKYGTNHIINSTCISKFQKTFISKNKKDILCIPFPCGFVITRCNSPLDTTDIEFRNVVVGPEFYGVGSGCFRQDSDIIYLSFNSDTAIKTVNIKTGEILATHVDAGFNNTMSLDVSPDGTVLSYVNNGIIKWRTLSTPFDISSCGVETSLNGSYSNISYNDDYSILWSRARFSSNIDYRNFGTAGDFSTLPLDATGYGASTIDTDQVWNDGYDAIYSDGFLSYHVKATTPLEFTVPKYNRPDISVAATCSAWSPDKKHFYPYVSGSYTVYEYTATDDQQWYEMTQTAATLYAGTYTTGVTGITCSRDGHFMYLCNPVNNLIYCYSMPKAWDLSSCSGNYLYTIAYTGVTGLSFSKGGKKAYILYDGGTNLAIAEFDLSESCDLSGRTLVNSHTTTITTGSLYGSFFVSEDGSHGFMPYKHGGGYAFVLTTNWDITSYSAETYSSSPSNGTIGLVLDNNNSGSMLHMDESKVVYHAQCNKGETGTLIPSPFLYTGKVREISAQKDTIRVTILAKINPDQVTINTDIICEASRDGGTTYVPVALDKQVYDESIDCWYLEGTADVSASPSGTSIVGRVKGGTKKLLVKKIMYQAE